MTTPKAPRAPRAPKAPRTSEPCCVHLNGARVTTRAETLADLVAEQVGDAAGHAVALDDEVVPRAELPLRRVRDGARIEIVTAVQGG